MNRLFFDFPALKRLAIFSGWVHVWLIFIGLLYYHPLAIDFFTWTESGRLFMRQWIVVLWVIHHGIIIYTAFILWHPRIKWGPWLSIYPRRSTFFLGLGVYLLFLTGLLGLVAISGGIVATYYAQSYAGIFALIFTSGWFSLIVAFGMIFTARVDLMVGLAVIQLLMFWLEPNWAWLEGWWPIFSLTHLNAAYPTVWQASVWVIWLAITGLLGSTYLDIH